MRRGSNGLQIVNLTPHDLVIFDDETIVLRVPPTGYVARLSEDRDTPLGITAEGRQVPLVQLRYSTGDDQLPTWKEGVLLVVSRVTAAHYAGRTDVVFPLDEVRRPDGTVIGCRALGRFAAPGDRW